MTPKTVEQAGFDVIGIGARTNNAKEMSGQGVIASPSGPIGTAVDGGRCGCRESNHSPTSSASGKLRWSGSTRPGANDCRRTGGPSAPMITTWLGPVSINRPTAWSQAKRNDSVSISAPAAIPGNRSGGWGQNATAEIAGRVTRCTLDGDP